MQIDMHYYGIYVLARCAGIDSKTAAIIAQASQFVDDATFDYAIYSEQSAILQIATAHSHIDYKNVMTGDHWKVWIPFHFLPGDLGVGFHEKIICRRGTESKLAPLILDYALQWEDPVTKPYIIGIVAHVYADSFAHYGFAGCNSELNKVLDASIKIDDDHSPSMKEYIFARTSNLFDKMSRAFMESVAPIGHGSVATLPDRPYLKWQFQYRHSEINESRHNPSDYVEACKNLLIFFKKCKNKQSNSDLQWDKKYEATFMKIIEDEGTQEERIDKWKELIESEKYFTSNAYDRSIKYHKERWQPENIIFNKDEISGFYRAAWEYRNFVLSKLLRRCGLLS